MKRSKSLDTMAVLALACGAIYIWYGKNPYFLLAGFILILIGLFVPIVADKIHWAWMKLAEGMGYVMSKVILSIVFIFILVPVATIARLFRKNTMTMKRSATTYFKERNFTYNKESLENVW